MKNHIPSIVLAAVTAIIVLCFWHQQYGGVSAGQVWVYGDDNPFRDGRETNTVTAVSGRYVQYSRIEKAWVSDEILTNIHSCSISWFKIGSTKIK